MDLLAAPELGDRLGAFGHSMLSKVSRKKQALCHLNLAASYGRGSSQIINTFMRHSSDLDLVIPSMSCTGYLEHTTRNEV